MLNNLNLHITYTVYRMFNILDARYLSLFAKRILRRLRCSVRPLTDARQCYYIRFECKVDIGLNLLIDNMLNYVLTY